MCETTTFKIVLYYSCSFSGKAVVCFWTFQSVPGEICTSTTSEIGNNCDEQMSWSQVSDAEPDIASYLLLAYPLVC